MSIFADLLDPHVALCERPLTETPPALFPELLECVANAVEKRRCEFLTGRACAHEALTKLGAPATPLLPGPDRVPLWPEGFTGSITHTDTYCAAVAARTGEGIHAIGIDLEPAEPLPADLWQTVCGDDELAFAEALPPGEGGVYARLLYCAKECAFKAQFPLTRTMLEFDEIAVAFGPEGYFEATFMRGVPQPSARGRIRVAGGFVASALVL